MEALFQDIRYSARALVKRPGTTLAAVLTLMLGIGANTAIFSVINAVLLRPLPFPDSDRLVQIWEADLSAGWAEQSSVSPYNFQDWQAQIQSFDRMAAYQYESVTMTGSGLPQRMNRALISKDFFQTLRVDPLLGRTVTEEKEEPGASRVAVISYRTWERRFGSDPAIVGKTLVLNGDIYTVVGVMQPGFQFPGWAEIWVPPAFDLSKVDRGSHFLFAVGRLKPGVTLGSAQAEADTVAKRLEQQYPGTNKGSTIALVSLQEQMVGRVRPALLILWAAVALVLLVACANVANLVLARGMSREKETAIRAAMGATRGRLIRQLLTESFIISVAGGALGLLLAFWVSRLLATAAARTLPRAQGIGLDGWVLAFAAGASVLSVVLFGLAPSLISSRLDLVESLKGSSYDLKRISGSRLRGLLVVSEVALSVVLLVGAGLLIKSFWLLSRVDPGFNANGLLTMGFSVPEAKYPDEALRTQLFQRLIDRIAAVPGVDLAGGVNDLPLNGGRTRSDFQIAGRESELGSLSPEPDYRRVSGNYFGAMGIPLLKGRSISTLDDQYHPGVAVINETMARTFWPDGKAIGAQLVRHDRVLEIVGVVGDVKHENLATPDYPTVYVPAAQAGSQPWIMFVVRSRIEPQALAGSIREAAAEIMPDEPLYNVQLMTERIASSISANRFESLLFGAFAVLALILTSVGIYGIMAHAVLQRTHEIGVRMALGAQRNDVIALVVRQGMVLTLTGMAIGLGGAIALTKFVASLLFGVGRLDAPTFAAAALLLCGVAFIACFIPARRAACVDPISAIRYE